MELLAQNQSNLPTTPESAVKTKIIWIKSAHGTYRFMTKHDRFEGKAWAYGNDYERVNYGLDIARTITEFNAGQPLTGNWEKDRKTIIEHGPWIVYAGRWDENRDLREAAYDPVRYMPKDRLYPMEKFHIIDGKIDNTGDVIRAFKVPPAPKYYPRSGDEIGVVCHSPHGMRFLFMLEQIGNPDIPKETILRMF